MAKTFEKAGLKSSLKKLNEALEKANPPKATPKPREKAQQGKYDLFGKLIDMAVSRKQRKDAEKAAKKAKK